MSPAPSNPRKKRAPSRRRGERRGQAGSAGRGPAASRRRGPAASRRRGPAASRRRGEVYVSPLVARNASPEMAQLFSPEEKFRTWRRLWIALAEAERQLGLPITATQIAQLKRHADDLNLDVARRYERRLRHDVMAHVHAFADQCPKARPILHLGATSCFVADNTDLILMRDALGLIRRSLVNAIAALADFARKHRSLPTLAYTHFQPAQPTTVGKRACLWIQDFVLDLRQLEHRLEELPFRGVKGTTGTQASFLQLFDGKAAKVERLDRLVARKMGFKNTLPVTGQTYPRKIDSQILAALADVAESAHKMANDIRLLSNLKEIEEPFGARQIGSSAMAYKRNPMRCERMTALARFVIVHSLNPRLTAAEQWLERTLDDSANRRLSLPQAFLATDGILQLVLNVASGLVVRKKVIQQNLDRQRPFLATEGILMAAVRAGGDRQRLHERIRQHSQAVARRVYEEGRENDLLQRLTDDPAFARIKDQIPALAAAKGLVGRAPQQVTHFLAQTVAPIRRKYRRLLGQTSRVEV